MMMNSPHPHLDMDDQQFAIEAHRGKMHSEWVQHHASKQQMDHGSSRAKALLLISEAARLELIHLGHQQEHCKFLLSRRSQQNNTNAKNKKAGNNINNNNVFEPKSAMLKKSHSASADCFTAALSTPASSPSSATPSSRSPSRCSSLTSDSECSPSLSERRRQKNMEMLMNNTPAHGAGGGARPSTHKRSSSAPTPCSPVACGCLSTAAWRLMTPRFRVMALLKKHGETGNLDSIVDALRQTYTSDAEMIEDMDSRYGPEPTKADPELLLRSVEERQANHEARWAGIRDQVDSEMTASQYAFPNVIRTLSVMRIFIEGSQGQNYGIDFGDRQRREAAQQAVLHKLRSNRALFIDDCPSSPSPQRVAYEQEEEEEEEEEAAEAFTFNKVPSSSSSPHTSKSSAITTRG